MANPKIYFANPGAWALSASGGANASYPLTNLQDFLRASWWYSNSNATSQTLVVDMGAATACNYAILEYGESIFPSELGWTGLDIDGADDSGFTTGVVAAFSGAPVAAATALYDFQGGATVTKRYWKFTFTLSAAGYPGLAQVFLGKSLDFSFPYEFGAKSADSSFQTVVGRSLSGVKRSSQAVGGTRVFDVQFRIVSDAVATLFRTFHDTVRGALRPFYFSPDGGTKLYYVSLSKDYTPVEMFRPGQNNIGQLLMETADSEVV